MAVQKAKTLTETPYFWPEGQENEPLWSEACGRNLGEDRGRERDFLIPCVNQHKLK